MGMSIILSSGPEETRMGLVEDGLLKEYLVERSEGTHLVGSIFLGRVCNVVPGIQAAFVDIGLEQNAFLFLGEEKKLTEGASVVVQISKDARGSKGPTATREITLPGRYVVLVPGAAYIGISKKIAAPEERERLQALVKAVQPEQMGIVVRTVAKGVEPLAIQADIKNLLAAWKVLEARVKVSRPPVALWRELDLPVRIVRDYLNQDVEQIVIDNKEILGRVQALLAGGGTAFLDRVSLYTGGEDIFAAYGVSDAIASISDRRVELPCGGYLVIDHTEAMTVIDVNSGKYSGKASLEETIMEINKEAAAAIAYQLRLRDIGGIIVVDFIDMHLEAHRAEVLRVLEASFAGDKMHPKVQDITVLNLVEITRKKSRQNLTAVLYAPCPTCQGSGRVQSPATVALEIKRRIRGLLSKQGSAKDLLLVAHPLLIEYIKLKQLREWSRELSCSIKLEADPALHVEAFMILDNS